MCDWARNGNVASKRERERASETERERPHEREEGGREGGKETEGEGEQLCVCVREAVRMCVCLTETALGRKKKSGCARVREGNRATFLCARQGY